MEQQSRAEQSRADLRTVIGSEMESNRIMETRMFLGEWNGK